MEDARFWFHNYQHAQLRYLGNQPSMSSSGTKWRTPDSGCLKLNVDASVVTGLDFVAVGAIIRDDQGFVMGAMAKKVYGLFSPFFIAECLAIREGLCFAADCGLRVQIVASDSLQATNRVRRRDSSGPEFPIVEDIVDLLDVLGGGSCCAISQLVNGAAYSLEHHAPSLYEERFWLEEILDCISNVVISNLIHNQ